MTHSIRTRLSLMLLTLAVPLVGAMGYAIYRDARQGASAAKASLHALATVLAHNAQRTVAHDPGLSPANMPANSRYGVYDAQGVLIWQNNTPQNRIDAPSADPAALHMVALKNGEFEALEHDGVKRIYAVAQVPDLNGVAFVGVPSDFVLARALEHARWTAAVGALVLGLLGWLVYTLAQRILAPVASLADGHLSLTRRVEELSRRLIRTQEETRQRFSQELHDRTSPNLAALRINLDIIANTVNGTRLAREPGAAQDFSDRIEDTRALIEDTNASIREICAGLHPSAIERGGLLGVIQSYALQFSKRTGIQTHVYCPHHEIALQPDLELALFRVFQEALTNCAKHAKATAVEVQVQLDGQPIFLSIADNGQGFDVHNTNTQSGLGLISMRETVELAGGQLRVESTPGRGTQVYVEI